MTKDPFGDYKELTDTEKKYFLSLKKEDITFSNLISLFGNTIDIRNNDKHKQITKSKFNVSDTLTINPGEYSLINSKEPVNTTLGRLLFNKILIEHLGFGSIAPYQNKVMNAKAYGSFESIIIGNLKDDRITVDQMVEYIDTRDWLGFQMHAMITSSFTKGVLTLPPHIKELKKKLLDENREAIESGDSLVMEKIERILIEETQKAFKGDIGMDLYNSGARGSVDNHLKNIMLTRGAIKNPATNKYEIIENSLMEGLTKKDITPHSNSIVSGAYPKSVGTADSGYMAKELLSAFQAEVLGDYDTDCGTEACITVTITAKNFNDYLYRYVKTNKGLILIDNENKDLFLDKTVKMRSPMYCIGTGPNKCLCNKCAGDFYYKLDKKNIGLVASKLSTKLTGLNMKKFHENIVKTHKIDLDDMLI